MSKKRIFECKACVQLFAGRVAYDYHMNVHKRTALPVKKVVAPKRARVYDGPNGEQAPLL